MQTLEPVQHVHEEFCELSEPSISVSFDISTYFRPLKDSIEFVYEMFIREPTNEFNNVHEFTDVGKDEFDLDQGRSILALHKIKYNVNNTVHKLMFKNIRAKLANHLKSKFL